MLFSLASLPSTAHIAAFIRRSLIGIFLLVGCSVGYAGNERNSDREESGDRGERVVIFEPQVYQRGTGGPVSIRSIIRVPSGIVGPFEMRVQNGEGSRRERISSGSISINDIQVVGPNDFNRRDESIRKTVQLAPENQLEVRLSGMPGGWIRVSLTGQKQRSIPVAMDPQRLRLARDAVGQVIVTLAPTPTVPGTLSVRSEDPAIARVPSGVSFAAGQERIIVPVEGRHPGHTEIQASLNGKRIDGKVRVSPHALSLSSLTPSVLDLIRGGNGEITVTLSAAPRRSVMIRLESSDSTIASVPSSVTVTAGQRSAVIPVTGLSLGNADVRASFGDQGYSSQLVSRIRVLPPQARLVSLLPVTQLLTLGAQTELQLSINAAQPSITTIPLSSSPVGIASLPAEIRIPAGQTSVAVPIGALMLGSASIVATLNGSSASAAVQVVPPAPVLTALAPNPLILRQDATGTLTATLNAAQLTATELNLGVSGSNLQISPTAIIPAGSLNVGIPVTGTAQGNAIVTARLGDTVSGSNQSSEVRVIPQAPVPVSLQPDPLPLQQGATGQLTLAINAAQLDDLVVSIANNSSALIQVPQQVIVPAGSTTVAVPVTGLAAGDASLTVTIDGAALTGRVTVTPPPPVVASLEPDNLSLPKGVPGRLRVNLTRAPIEATEVLLSSSDTGIADVPTSVTVAAGSLVAEIPVMSKSEGRVTVTASLNGGSAATQVSITAPELLTITLSPQNPLVYVGESLAVTATGLYTDASNRDITAQVAWSSSDVGVASMASTGVLSALAAGSTTLKAQATASTVNPAMVVGSTLAAVETVPTLMLSPAETSLKVDEALTLTLTSSAPAEGGGLPVTLVTGGGGNVSLPVSLVIPAGQNSVSFAVNGVAPGDVTIIASAPRRLTANARITVKPKLEVTALNPVAGPVGMPITISGRGFDANPAGNAVSFNGVAAVVAAASATHLDVIVPVKASTGPVVVTTSQGSAQSPQAFVVQQQQDFSLGLAPATLQAPPGAKSYVRVRMVDTGLLPYAHAVSLSLGGLPAGVTASFDKPSLSLRGESSLALTVAAGTAAGVYPVAIQAVGLTDAGLATRSQTLSLEILPPGATTVSGRVLHAEDDSPFVGARIRLGGQEAFTDASGFYRFGNPTVIGDQVLLVDGHTANTATVNYAAAIAVPILIQVGQENTALTSYISAVDATRKAEIVPGTQADVTMPDLPNYALNIPAGAVLYGWDGTPVTQISVRTIPADRLPIKPLPPGFDSRSVYLYYFFREGGANPTQPIPVTMINDLDAVPGEKVEMWYYDESTSPDPNSNQWKMMGLGTVSADGKSLVSDPGVGIPKFCCGATTARRNSVNQSAGATGANGGDGNGDKSCDPVDLATGNNLPFEMRGFGIKALLPVNINCQYRSTDPRIGLFGRGTSFTYDWLAASIGNTVQITTPDGVKYSLAKEADGVYRAQTGKAGALGWEVRATASGRTLRLPQGSEMDFNANGLLTQMRDSQGRSVRIGLDGNGYINSLTDSNGRGYTITTTNYAVGRTLYPLITSVTDILGRVVRYSYDGSGRLATHTDAAGSITRYDYDGSNRVIRRTLPNGGAINFQYDAAGRTIQETLEDGVATIRYAYTTVGSVVTGTLMTDSLGRTTEYRFNGQGYTTRTIDALGRIRTQLLDPATNLVKESTDWAGRVTRNVYDSKGNLTQVTDPLGNVSRFDYDPVWNKPIKLTDPLGRITAFQYDSKGRLITSTDALGQVSRNTWNMAGLIDSTTDPLGRIARMSWDNEGNLTAAIDPLGRIWRYRYDDANRLADATDPLGNTSSRVYDLLDRVTQSAAPDGGLTQLTYDALDRLTQVTDPRGSPVERRSYNLRGQMIQTVDAANRATSYQYDLAGNLTQVTDRKGQITRYAYDALNRRTRIDDADGRITTYDYDLAGNVARISDNRSGDLLMSYDMGDRLTRVISDQGTLDYQYDAIGRRIQRTLNGGDPTTYQYDALDRLIAIGYRGKTTSYRYDAVGRLVQKALPNGLQQTYTWDDGDQLTQIQIQRSDGSLLETVSYAYDAAGRRIRREATVAGVAETPLQASYDVSNRLTSLVLNGQSYSLSYDANGNLVQKQAGNGQITTYSWDARNRLIGIDGQQNGSALTARFKYDALGRRQEKTVNGSTVQYLYDGANAIAELRGNAIDATLLTGLQIDEMIARYTREGERTLLTDALGSVILTTKDDQTVVTAYGYSPYGETQVMGTEEGNSAQYTARENDRTGLYYYRARYYDPQLKRWLSEDPIGLAGGMNVYSYVEGNPVSATDPSGLDTYRVNRDLQFFGNSAAASWNPATHTFVAVTNPDGSIAATYSWGNQTNLTGWNLNAPLDLKTAAEAIAAGKAKFVGGADLDPFVQDAFNKVKSDRPHDNGIVTFNCKLEADHLIFVAKQRYRAANGNPFKSKY